MVQQQKIIKELNELKNYLVKTNSPLNFINVINECLEIISNPLPTAAIEQEDFLPLESFSSPQIVIKNSTLIISSDTLATALNIPPSNTENLEENSNGVV
jgi:hypothetical protein